MWIFLHVTATPAALDGDFYQKQRIFISKIEIFPWKVTNYFNVDISNTNREANLKPSTQKHYSKKYYWIFETWYIFEGFGVPWISFKIVLKNLIKNNKKQQQQQQKCWFQYFLKLKTLRLLMETWKTLLKV